MIIDEVPRGQLSTIILMTLLEKDKYGYEIIDEVLKVSNGKVSIKQPSLYSSLKRMEDQSLISSYWRDSEIGGRRHYYHLTDLGKKHLEKWKTDLPDFSSSKQNTTEKTDSVKILQQENLFNLNSIPQKSEEKVEELKKDDTFVQFDLFSNSTIVTPPSQDNSFFHNDVCKSEPIESSENSNKILTSYEVQDNTKKQTFEYVKKTNKSFSDTITNHNSSYENKYINQTKEQQKPDYLKQETVVLSEQTEKTPDISFKQDESLQHVTLEDSTIQPLDEKLEIDLKLEENVQSDTNQNKDDGVFITERLDIEDMPKPTKWDSRRFEQYISANNVATDLKPSKKATNYEDRVKELYEQSKSNPENQELELIDNKVKFSNYKLLQQFYSEQNIKFKPFEKSLKKTDKDYNMLRITKLNLFTSISVFIFTALVTLVCGLIFSNSDVFLNHPITYVVFPSIALLFFICNVVGYIKAPQKRIALDLTKYKFNFILFIAIILLIPIIFAINFMFGFSFSNFGYYSLSLIYPTLLTLNYVVYFFTQKLILKSKIVF